MSSARSLRPSPPLSPAQRQRLDAVEERLRLCKLAAALSLGVGVAAWAFANFGADRHSGATSLAIFTIAVLTCVVATGAGSLLESERDRLRKAGG